MQIELQQELAQKLKDHVGEDKVVDYIHNILEKSLASEADDFSEEDEEKVKERLRNLGYLE